jgi:hypothetical protein
MKNKYVLNFKKFTINEEIKMKKINNELRKLNDFIVDFLRKLKKEGAETSEAAAILKRYAMGKKVSKEEMDIFRNQILDVIKILGIGIPFTVIPGSSLLLPLVIAIAKKYKIDILPSSFRDEK